MRQNVKYSLNVIRMTKSTDIQKQTIIVVGQRGNMMNDLISRQAAIDALEKVAELFPWRVPGNRDTYDRYNAAWNDAIGRAEIEIEELPSAQPDLDEWCTDCKEYDQERHSCPRWNRVIRKTVDELELNR